MNIVLTYADENAEKNLKERFLPSLFREGQLKGTLVICDYGDYQHTGTTILNAGLRDRCRDDLGS